MAAKYDSSDLIGRIMVMDQAMGSVQGIITIQKAQKGTGLGSLSAVVSLQIKGESVNTTCSGSLEDSEQTMNLICDNNTKVLSLKLQCRRSHAGTASRG